MALQERLSIIQGPPGCGKTLVVTAIVANWMKNLKKIPRILVCAPSNTAADFIAERLYQIPLIQDKVIRFYPDKREDIFNIDLDRLKPYHMLSKILYMDKEWQATIAQNIHGIDDRRRNILTYVNFYFSEWHLATNENIRKLISQTNDSGYIYIHEILGWGMMKKHRANEYDIAELAQYSENFEVDSMNIKIRRRDQ